MSSYRFPPIPPSQLSDEQKKAEDVMDGITAKSFGKNGETFKFKNDEGAYVGPFAILLRTPAAVKPYFDLYSAFSRLEGFPPRCRELAILAIGGAYKSTYELYAHSSIAESKAIGLSHGQVEAARSGKTPSGLSEQEMVTYEAALALSKPGNLSQELFDRLGKELGEDGRLALVHYVGIYAYTSVLLNAGAVPAEGPY